MNTAKSSAQLVRAPSPVGCNKPVMTHLTEDERNLLSKIAKQESRSLAATARMMIVKGLDKYQAGTE